MTPIELKDRKIEAEFVYLTSRSGGPGGQNVNKVSTKVELRFNIANTNFLKEKEKCLVLWKLKNKINKESELILVSQSERTQLLNKQNVTEKFYELVSKALTIPEKRKATKPTFTSQLKRIEKKKLRGQVKKSRQKFDPE